MKDELTGLQDDSEGWKEHAEAHYAQEDRMTKLDWFKAIVGALITVPVMYAMMVIIMVL
jgi:hypothetical protein